METSIKNWLERAKHCLEASLKPVPNELNELDWKLSLSPNSKRLTEHLAAFSNYSGGGFLVFGVEPLKGEIVGCPEEKIEEWVKTLANLGRQSVEPPIALDHLVVEIGGCNVLFVHIQEADIKPVHLRGSAETETFVRCLGTTRKASKQEVGAMMLHSRLERWEDLRASNLLTNDEMVGSLDIGRILQMLEKPIPSDADQLLERMVDEEFVALEPSGGGYITNLGAISAARALKSFPDLERKAVRVVIYEGKNKEITKLEAPGTRGYAIGFQGMIGFINGALPKHEIIENALRKVIPIYPEITVRELVANALIHQDFTIRGAGPMVEIFADRVEITNPGGLLPSKQLARLIGTNPESRNESLAYSFRRYGICEERGSGLQKAAIAAEFAGLPALGLESGSNYFKATIYGPRPFLQMSLRERINACFQHCVIRFVSGETMTNSSLRERFKLPESQRTVISALIREVVAEGTIKAADPDNRSPRHSEYVPAWA